MVFLWFSYGFPMVFLLFSASGPSQSVAHFSGSKGQAMESKANLPGRVTKEVLEFGSPGGPGKTRPAGYPLQNGIL